MYREVRGMNFKRVFSDLNIFRREYLRNRTGMFFALVFPIILIVIFGAIFAGGSSGPVTVYVQNQDGSNPTTNSFINALNSTGTITLVSVSPSVNFSQYLVSNSYNQGIVIPSGFSQSYLAGQQVNLTIYNNPADTSSGIVIGTLNAVINEFNLKHANAPAILGANYLTVKSQSYKYIDFLIPGLVGFAILTSPMFSMVNISAEYKKTKLFKQLSLTPLTKGEWLLSKVIWYIVLSIISFVLMIVFGVLLFGAQVTISAWIIPFLIVGPLFFVALGMLVGTITKSQESAGVIGNIITFPMMFLAGTFFPVSSMPAYLQAFARVLPLYYLIDGLNNVMIFNNYGQTVIDIVVLCILAAVVFFFAVRVFKWREG
jgi:ABC-2 type transport system permease protein